MRYLILDKCQYNVHRVLNDFQQDSNPSYENLIQLRQYILGIVHWLLLWQFQLLQLCQEDHPSKVPNNVYRNKIQFFLLQHLCLNFKLNLKNTNKNKYKIFTLSNWISMQGKSIWFDVNISGTFIRIPRIIMGTKSGFIRG